VTSIINPPSAIRHFSTSRLRYALPGSLAGLIAGWLYAGLLASQQISPMMSVTDLPGDGVLHLLLSAMVGLVFGW